MRKAPKRDGDWKPPVASSVVGDTTETPHLGAASLTDIAERGILTDMAVLYGVLRNAPPRAKTAEEQVVKKTSFYRPQPSTYFR
ncbi:hypothetical protein MY11210_009077 [Beauveria gryllotalpidicola]